MTPAGTRAVPAGFSLRVRYLPDMDITDDEIARELMALALRRGPDKSFCPSEAARALARDWRPLMPEVRRIAATLPLRATQTGVKVDPLTARGPIRLALRPGDLPQLR